MKKIKGWKLFLFALAGMGPNLLMTLMTGYLNDALLAPMGIDPAKTFTGSIIVSAGLCSVLFFLAKIIDALIDVPMAYLSDRFKCRFGKRRLTILLGWIPMMISFLLLWSPKMFLSAGHTGVTWIEAILLVVYYSSYTLCLVAYYGAYSAITENERDRARLCHYKAFFDTIHYCVAYALFPALLLHLLGGTEPGAVSNALMKLFPLMFTIVIALVLIKGENNDEEMDERVPFLESMRISVSSKPFRGWLLTQLMLHMGLMLFLTGIGTTIPDSLMGIGGWQITVMNSAAFAPVPLMLVLFNAIKKRRGSRFALQTALVAFAVAMGSFAFAWRELWNNNSMISFIIGLIASTIGSYGVGVFFSVSYYYPSEIAAREMATTHRDHAAMYFAIQGLVTQMASAIGVNLIYMNLISRDITLFGHQGGQFFVVPLLAGVLMLAAAACSFTMERDKF